VKLCLGLYLVQTIEILQNSSDVQIGTFGVKGIESNSVLLEFSLAFDPNQPYTRMTIQEPRFSVTFVNLLIKFADSIEKLNFTNQVWERNALHQF